MEIKIIDVRRNEDDLHFPFVITDSLGEINLPTQVGMRFLKGNCEEWIGQKLQVEKRVARKYVRYYINLEKFGFDDYKEWKIKELKLDAVYTTDESEAEK